MIIGIGVCTVVGIMMFIGKVDVQFKESYMHLTASLTGSTDVYYADIENVEMVSDIDLGTRVFGVGSARLQAGKFKNQAYGSYHLYAYTNVKSYIVIQTKNEYVLVNDKDVEMTKDLYEIIQSKK